MAVLRLVRGGSQAIIDAADNGSPELLFSALKSTISRHDAGRNSTSQDAIKAIATALSFFPSPPETATRYLKDTLRDWLKSVDLDTKVREHIIEVFGSRSCEFLRFCDFTHEIFRRIRP